MSEPQAGAVDSESYIELCSRIREGDQRAEAVLLTRLEPGLRLILRRATGGDRELTRELCQETLIIVLQRLRTSGLRDPTTLAGFAGQTARNLAIADQRKTRRRRTEADETAVDRAEAPARDQVDELATGRTGELVRRLLHQLPSDRDRLVLTRFYLNEEDKAAICHDLHLTEPSFNQILFRARNRFRELVDASGHAKDLLLTSEVPRGSEIP
jgi:RNA polymerase sigma-70 factor, ECF subfamily